MSAIRSKEMLMSWPVSSLVAGVKIGSGSLLAVVSPGGNLIPQTSPVSLYSLRPEPTR